MIEVNKDFIKAMQKRLDEKEKIYTGELSYKNMLPETLWFRITEQTKIPEVTLTPNEHQELLVKKVFKDETLKELVDIANLCWMLWERLEENK
jgi:hypothetical protein